MLTNTLVLPESDVRLAVRMLQDAIASLDVVLMLVLGKDDKARKIVEWADQLCNKTATPDGNLRHVVWVRDLSTTTMKDALKSLIKQDPLPRVAAFNFFDQLKGTLTDADPVDPVELELLFLKGHAS